MNRRGFLKGCLVAGVAPAFVKADSLMGLWVPKKEIINTVSGTLGIQEGEVWRFSLYEGQKLITEHSIVIGSKDYRGNR